MMQISSKFSQLNTVVISLELQKKRVKNQLYNLMEIIKKKNNSLTKFQVYADEYKNKFCNLQVFNAHEYATRQVFLDQLASVIFTEKTELEKLEQQKTELIAKYHSFSTKISGVNQLLDEIRKEKINFQSNIADNELAESALACHQRKDET